MKVLVDKVSGVIYDVERPWLGGNIPGGDDRCLDYAVFDYLIDWFEPDSLVDVGCGDGHLMKYFQEKGVKVTGIDGLEANIENAPKAIKDKIVLHDYVNSPLAPIETDMVISCEFVEHVHKRYIVNFLPQFIFCDTLVFTHARVGQQGYHHVNCEEDPYWINLITSFGMEHLDKETEEARALVGPKSFWETILIFKNPFA